MLTFLLKSVVFSIAVKWNEFYYNGENHIRPIRINMKFYTNYF